MGWVNRRFLLSVGLGWVMGLNWQICEKYMQCIGLCLYLICIEYRLANSFCENVKQLTHYTVVLHWRLRAGPI